MDRGTWGGDDPPEEAYSRVSDETRYLTLHAIADRLVSRLVARYRVEAEPTEVDGRWRGGVERATVLTPDGGGTPVTVIWTGFGVVVRAGHAYQRGFPSCGCDACDEDPDHLATELEETVGMAVAGGLAETRRPRLRRDDEVSIELRDDAGRSSGMGGPHTAFDAVPLGTTTWPAWPPR